MLSHELIEQAKFATEAIERKTKKQIEVKVIVMFKDHAMVLDIKEIGFDDKTATIFIEA